MKKNTSEKEIPVSSFLVISGSLKEKGEPIYSEIFATSQEKIKEIVVPITLAGQEKMTIKQLHDCSFIVFLPDSIINIASNLEFIVNGWAILDKPINSAVWVPNPTGFSWFHVGKMDNLKRSAANNPKIAPAWSLWRINLFQGIPKKYNGIPGGIRPFFRKTYSEEKAK